MVKKEWARKEYDALGKLPSAKLLGETVLTDVKLLQNMLNLPDARGITEYAAKQDMAVPPGSYYKAGAKVGDAHTRSEIAKVLKAVSKEQLPRHESTTRYRYFIIDGTDFDRLIAELEGK